MQELQNTDVKTNGFNVFDFSLEFFVFCLILNIFCTGCYTDGVRFWWFLSCRNGRRLLSRLGGRTRGRVSGHDGWCERRRETPTAGSAEVYWRIILTNCSVGSPRHITDSGGRKFCSTRPGAHQAHIYCLTPGSGRRRAAEYDLQHSQCFPRRKPTSRGNPTIPTHTSDSVPLPTSKCTTLEFFLVLTVRNAVSVPFRQYDHAVELS